MRSSLIMLLQIFIVSLISCTTQAQQHYDTISVHFGFNRYDVPKEDAARLGHFLKEHPAKTDSLYIIGFTDTVGTREYNKKLSLLRAQSVALFIKGSILTPLSISGKGEEEPVAGNDSLSRRVLIIARKISRAAGPDLTTSTGQHAGVSTAPSNTDSFSVHDHQPDTVINLTNINFEEDTPNLTESSRMVLPAYIQFLKRYKDQFIEIDGYCNSRTPIRSKTDPLFLLSVKRAKLIFDFLIDEGFDPSRLSYKGMGDAFPKNANPATDEEARANMRVEVLIYHK